MDFIQTQVRRLPADDALRPCVEALIVNARDVQAAGLLPDVRCAIDRYLAQGQTSWDRAAERLFLAAFALGSVRACVVYHQIDVDFEAVARDALRLTHAEFPTANVSQLAHAAAHGAVS